MKLSNIISTSLLETDDMFPGVASSVFDDATANDQPEPDMSNLDWLQEQIDKYQSVADVYFRKCGRILDDMEKNAAKVYIGTAGTGKNAGPNIIAYSSFDWLDKYNVSGIGRAYGIEKSSPYLKDIENTFRIMDELHRRERFFREKVRKFRSTMKKIVKQQRKGKI